MKQSTPWHLTLHQLRELCNSADGSWIERKRVFDSFLIITSLLDLCVGESQSYRSVMHRLFEDSSSAPAASSFCAARSKMPALIIANIREEILDRWDDEEAAELWHGRVPYIVDGSKINLPKQLSEDHFRIPHNGYYPQGLLTAVFRASDRMLFDLKLASSWNEREQANGCLDELSSGDLLVYDRGYFCSVLILEHLNRGIDAVFRIPKGSSFPEINNFWASENDSCIVTITPNKKTLWKTKQSFFGTMPDAYQLRLIKYKIANEIYVLATTVLDESISTEDFQVLYGKRWAIEEFFKPYKQSIQIEKFHARSLRGVEQELQATALLWNLTMFMDRMIPEDLKKNPIVPRNIPLPNELPSKPNLRQQSRRRTFSKICA